MLSPGDALRHLRDDGLQRVVKKVARTYVFSRRRVLVTYINWVDDLNKPLDMNGYEVRPAQPDDPFAEAFPHLTPATITTWLRPDHFFRVLLRGGQLAGYRCAATTASPSVRPFFCLRPHQLFIVDHFVRPELRRLGLARLMRLTMAREVVACGFSEAFAIEMPTNYDAIISGQRRGNVRIGTLTRTCRLGRVRFALTPTVALWPELVRRQLAILRRAAPQVSHAGVLFNPTVVTTTPESEQVTIASVASLGARVTFLPVADTVAQTRAFEEALAAGRDVGIQGLIVASDPMMLEFRRVVVRLVERLRLPAVYDAREFVAVGGLMSCGSPPPRFADLGSALAYRTSTNTLGHWRPNPGEPAVTVSRKAAATLGLALPCTPGRR